MPKAVHVAVLSNPANVTRSLGDAQEAARAIGLQLHVFNASTSREIGAAFATFASERPDALFVGGDSFFNSRRVQFANAASRHAIPAIYGSREFADRILPHCSNDRLWHIASIPGLIGMAAIGG